MKVFDSFRLDAANQSLLHNDRRVAVTPKAFEVLRYFVEHAGRLVTQDELLEAVWPDTYVNPELIKKYIKEIRKALGDSPTESTFIRTYPKRGYEFIAPVMDEAHSARVGSSEQSNHIVGREAALEALSNALQKASRSVRQIVFVTGEAGIGKTTLVDTFLQRHLSVPGLQVARGQSVEGFGGKEPYYPVLEALGQLLRLDAGTAAVDVVLKQAPTWMIQFPSLIKPEHRDILHRDILGTTRERMLREICEALEVLSLEAPLCLVLEDLHWSDVSTLDFISAMSRRRAPARVLLVGTYRPVDVVLSQSPLKAIKQDLVAHQLCTEIALEQLEPAQIAQYLASKHKIDQAQELANLVYRHSGGNALFMVAIVQELTKHGVLQESKEGTQLTVPITDIEVNVPETLQHLLDLQFEQLSAREQQVLKAASVVGERFSAWTLAPLVELTAEAVDEVCATLAERAQFVRAAGRYEHQDRPASPMYDFKHSLYRHSVYRKLSEINRSRLHRTLGQQLSTLYTPERPEIAAELALHFEEGGDYENAVRYLVSTAENAARRFAHRETINILCHARQFLPKLGAGVRSAQEMVICKSIGDAHYSLGEVLAAAESYAAEVALAAQVGDAAAQISALSRLGYASAITDAVRGIAASERAVEVAKSAEPMLVKRTEVLAAGFRLVLDRWRREDADTCSAAAEYKFEERSPAVNESIYASHASLFQGRYAEALQILEGCSPHGAGAGSLTQYLPSWVETLCLLHQGQLGHLISALRRAIALARRNGNKLWLGAFTGVEAWLRTACVDFEGAKTLCEPVLTCRRERATRTPDVLALLFLGHAEIGLGNSREALHHFSAVEEITADKFYLHWYWRLLAQLGVCNAWLKLGNVSNATRKSEAFLAAANDTDDPNLQALACEAKARAAIAAGAWQEAEPFIQQALKILQRVEIPLTSWHVNGMAWQIYRSLRAEDAAELYRKVAAKDISKIAESLPVDEPLRSKFLGAPAVAQIVNGGSRTKISATASGTGA